MSSKENKLKIRRIREEHTGIITVTSQNPRTGVYETTKVRIVRSGPSSWFTEPAQYVYAEPEGENRL